MGALKSSPESLMMLDDRSRKGGWLCQSLLVACVPRSRRSRNGRLPSGEAPDPVSSSWRPSNPASSFRMASV
eukprot:scaffold649170_cov37-Prasinocladus_malaysianus.AAC.1